MSGCPCPNEQPRKRGCGIFKMLLEILFLYVVLVFGGGTLINTGHPVAAEVGRLIHTVTFVEPTIRWAQRTDHDMLAGGIGRLARGVDVGAMIAAR